MFAGDMTVVAVLYRKGILFVCLFVCFFFFFLKQYYLYIYILQQVGTCAGLTGVGQCSVAVFKDVVS